MVSATSHLKEALVITPWLSPTDLPIGHAYTLEPGRPTPGRANLLRPPIASQAGAGILTRFPSATTLVLTLGADSPCADERGAGNLGLSATELFTLFIATHVSIRTSDTSSNPHESPSPAYGTLSYHAASDPNFLLPPSSLERPSQPFEERLGLGRARCALNFAGAKLASPTLAGRTRSLNQMQHP